MNRERQPYFTGIFLFIVSVLLINCCFAEATIQEITFRKYSKYRAFSYDWLAYDIENDSYLERIWDKYKLNEQGFKYQFMRNNISIASINMKDKLIYLNISNIKSFNFSEDAITFIIFHEVGHSKTYSNDSLLGQIEADCWALKKLKQENINFSVALEVAKNRNFPSARTASWHNCYK